MHRAESAARVAPHSSPQPPNRLGAFGFALALIGMLGLATLTACTLAEVASVSELPAWTKLAFGALSPLGLLLSAGAAFRLPKKLATAGILLGLLGTLWLASVGVLLVADAMGLFSNPEDVARQREADAIAAIKAATELVEAEQVRRGGIALDDETGRRLISGRRDGWGKPLIYQRINNDFEIISAGPDKEYGSEDDITSRTIGRSEFDDGLDGW